MKKYLHLYVVNKEKQVVAVDSVAEGLAVAISDYYVIGNENTLLAPYYIYSSNSFEDIALCVGYDDEEYPKVLFGDIFVYPASDRLKEVCLLNSDVFDQKYPQYSFEMPYCINEDGRADLMD